MSVFTIRVTDTNGITAEKEFDLSVVSGPFWDDFAWDPANEIPGDPPGTSNYNWPPDANGEFDLEISQGADPARISGEGLSLAGELTYTGPAVNVNVHVVVPVGVTGVQSARVTLSHNFVDIIDGDISAPGTYDFPVTVPESVAIFCRLQTLVFLETSINADEYACDVTLE